MRQLRIFTFSCWLISVGVTAVAQRCLPPSAPKSSTTATLREVSTTISAFDFCIVAMVQTGATQTLDGQVIKSLGDGPISLSDRGDILFSAYTEKSGNNPVTFLNDHAVAYIGMQIEQKVIYSFPQVKLSKQGSYAFRANFTDLDGHDPLHTPHVGVFQDGKTVLKDGDKFENGDAFYGFQGGEDFKFDDEGHLVLAVIGQSVSGQTRRLTLVDGKITTVAAVTPDEPPVKTNQFVANKNHQLIYRAYTYTQTREGNTLPNATGGFVMNDSGQIFTSDLQFMKYADALPNISQTYWAAYNAEHDKYVIDIPYGTLFGLRPLKLVNGKPVYDSQKQSRQIAINSKGQVAFYVSWVSSSGQAAMSGNALVIGTPKGAPEQLATGCTITSRTLATVPGQDSGRTHIGVGEWVELTSDVPVTWGSMTPQEGMLSAYIIGDQASQECLPNPSPAPIKSNQACFTAPYFKRTSTIRATTSDGSCSKTFSVIPPTGLIFQRLEAPGYGFSPSYFFPNLDWDVEMWSVAFLTPGDVSFANAFVSEHDRDGYYNVIKDGPPLLVSVGKQKAWLLDCDNDSDHIVGGNLRSSTNKFLVTTPTSKQAEWFFSDGTHNGQAFARVTTSVMHNDEEAYVYKKVQVETVSDVGSFQNTPDAIPACLTISWGSNSSDRLSLGRTNSEARKNCKKYVEEQFNPKNIRQNINSSCPPEPKTIK